MTRHAAASTRTLALLALAAPLAWSPPAAAGDGVPVVIWGFERGGGQLNPQVNVYIADAVAEGLGVASGGLDLVALDTLTPAALAGAEYAFLWAFRGINERIEPLTQAEQDALRDWVHAGGALFISEDLDNGDPDVRLGAPFGLHVDGFYDDAALGPVIAQSPVTAGPYAQPASLAYNDNGVLDAGAFLPGFQVLAETVDQVHPLLGWYDRGVLAPGSGPICIATDADYITAGLWDEDWGGILSNFFHYASTDAGCNAADVAEPFGVLDLADVGAFVAGFVGLDAVADLNTDGVWDLADVGLFVAAFTAGCP